MLFEFFDRRVQPVLSVRRLAQKRQCHDAERAPFNRRMMGVETWPRIRWLLEIILEIEPADADQCIANFRSFSLAEAVVNQIVADGDAFEQTGGGVRVAAVHGVVRFMSP